MYDRIRDLHGQITNFEGTSLYDDAISPWLKNDGLIARSWLKDLRDNHKPPQTPWDNDDAVTLYALSRIIDLLLLSFTPQPEGTECWRFPRLTPNEFQTFTDALGLETFAGDSFHPFFHEIVEVEQASDQALLPIIVNNIWPGLKLGNWIISRAGCNIRAGANHIRKDVAETSIMYWAYARNHRATQDLSVGWGSQSQWRTRFRQDCHIDGKLFYNILKGDETDEQKEHMVTELSADARLELVRHRCFIKFSKDHPPPDWDPYPYYLEHTEQLNPQAFK